MLISIQVEITIDISIIYWCYKSSVYFMEHASRFLAGGVYKFKIKFSPEWSNYFIHICLAVFFSFFFFLMRF